MSSQILRLDINTDELVFVEHHDLLVVGGYQLVDGATQSKRGLISVHATELPKLAPSIKSTPLSSYAIEDGGVFQLQYDSALAPGLLHAATSQGDILSLSISEEGSTLTPSAAYFVHDGSSRATTGVNQACLTEIDGCYSDGSIRVWSIGRADTPLWEKEGAHGAEVWQSMRSDHVTMLSGGDDSSFCVWDLRDSGRQRPAIAVRSYYGAGVTSFAPVHSSTPHLVAVGSYDETLAVWDLRACSGKQPQPISALRNVGGGLWRLKPRAISASTVMLLASCMHGGWRVFSWSLSLGLAEAVRYPARGAEDPSFPHGLPSALAYGACWMSDSWVAGCSFYDNTISCWPCTNK